MSAPLTDADVERTFSLTVADWILDRLDTSLGTDGCVRFLRGHFQTVGIVTSTPDGPYSDGENAVYWHLWIDQEKRGFHAKIERTSRSSGKTTTVREGLLSWNRLANMATIAACERKRTNVPPGTQMVIL